MNASVTSLFEFFRIEIYRIYRICRILFSVILEMKMTKNSILQILQNLQILFVCIFMFIFFKTEKKKLPVTSLFTARIRNLPEVTRVFFKLNIGPIRSIRLVDISTSMVRSLLYFTVWWWGYLFKDRCLLMLSKMFFRLKIYDCVRIDRAIQSLATVG